MGLPVWIEVHFDDEVLKADPARFSEARDLAARLADLAEGRGARLCFRFRERFARAAAGTPLLPDLERRGHEIGVHAHGKRFPEAADAVRACGVAPVVAVPGLVQSGLGGRGALLRECATYGFRLVTDHCPERAWAYEGLLPRNEEGVTVMAPTVTPFDWGLMERDGRRNRVSEAATAALRRKEEAAAAQGAAYFGAALHEHDLCPEGSLVPLPGALDALAAYLDGRVLPSLAVPLPSSIQTVPSRPADRSVRFARGWGSATSLVRRAVDRRRGGWRPPPKGANQLEVGDRWIAVERHGPPEVEAAVVVSHSGPEGGRRTALAPFGLGVHSITGRLWSLWLYDRAGTGKSPGAGGRGPGNPAFTEDWLAVLAQARNEGVPVIALCWSAGILPVLRAAARGQRPDALVDGEAPADRWSLQWPRPAEFAHKDLWNESDWVGLEAARMIGSLGLPYARLQGEDDHVHGPMHEHSGRMIAAARAAGAEVHDPGVLAGRLHGHGERVLEAVQWAVDRAVDRAGP